MSVKELKKTKEVHILIIGDIMLDKYIVGEVNRISPEAPVAIVKVTEEYHTLGGCGNVIRNLRELDVNVSCCARIGGDQNGETIVDELKRLKVNAKLVIDGDCPTITKTRVVAGERRTQMIRIDREEIIYEENWLIDSNLAAFNKEKVKFDLIIISDYAKGFITHNVMVRARSFQVPIIVDPKPIHNHLYYNVFMITPNQDEYNNMSLMSNAIFGKGVSHILKTMGSKGMELINLHDSHNVGDNVLIPADEAEVYNVSGAGDTVVAIVASCIGMGMHVQLASRVANSCAGYVVTKPGTTVVPKILFSKYVSKYNNKYYRGLIKK